MIDHEPVQWRVSARVDKFHAGECDPYAQIVIEGNMLMTVGANDLFNLLIGGGGINYAAPCLGVGDSTTAAAVAQTDLQASTNKFRQGMDATYPALATNTLTLRTTFGSSSANFAWNEWGVFSAAAGGHMLNRKVTSFGTKNSGDTWQFTVTLSLS